MARSQSLDTGLTASSSFAPSSSTLSSHGPPSPLLSFPGVSGGGGGGTESSDIHICILCMKALMNNAVSLFYILAWSCTVKTIPSSIYLLMDSWVYIYLS